MLKILPLATLLLGLAACAVTAPAPAGTADTAKGKALVDAKGDGRQMRLL